MIEIQYIIGGALSFLVSLFVLTKGPKTIVSKCLSIFGFTITIWEAATFLFRTAPDVSPAMIFFRIMILSSHLCYPIFLFTILNIGERKSHLFLLAILLPAIIQTAIIFQNEYIVNYQFFQNEFGWTYTVKSYQPTFVFVSVIFMLYLCGVVLALLILIRNSKVKLLRKKYIVLLVSFVSFQILGTTLVNALQATAAYLYTFYSGGIMQFCAFLAIWYVLSLKEKTPITLAEKSEGFSKIYSSFLEAYYQYTVKSYLGEEFQEFKDFLINSKIEDHVSFGKKGVTFTEPDKFDVIGLISRNLTYFEKHQTPNEATDYFLRVLNVTDYRLEWQIYNLIQSKLEFLKKIDLVYGISQGRFLENIDHDESLSNLNEIEACLRIYKRILLPIAGKIQNIDIQAKTRFTETIKINRYGEVSLKEIKSQVQRIPSDQRMQYIIETFNNFLSFVYDKLLADSKNEIDEILNKLRLVLLLNKDVAISLGVYPSLLGTLATKVPKTQIYELYSDYLEELIDEKTRELKEVQENLLKSQRLAAIGEAAAMVGHDLRNPLQAIINVLYLARIQMESLSKGELKESLDVIEEQVEYMNKIVSDLQDYARPVKPEIVEVESKSLLNETLLAIKVPETVKVSVDVKENATIFLTDSYLLKRVFTNLIINAIQAMPNGGRLSIKVSGTSEEVFFGFKDTGVGISEENLKKMFLPLFTTKAKGQGLGLAVCKRLVEALNGSITVESVVGKGTTFIVKISRGTKKADKVLQPQMAQLNS
jgi:signal transduction histidine kinase